MKNLIVFCSFIFLFARCSETKSDGKNIAENPEDKAASFSGKIQTATLAGGCFWCMEAPFEDIDGIISVTSGFAGGTKKNPTYKEVSSGKTDYRESVQIKYDPEIISYSEILRVYWKQFNPTDEGGSFTDRGMQYDPAIFYHNKQQKEVAEKSKKKLNESGIFDKPVVTKIMEFTTFYPAEEYHQDFYKKKPERYHSYKKASGRAGFIKNTWGKIDDSEYTKTSQEKLKKKLTDLQYNVTQNSVTEKAFNNKYFDNHKAGIYVGIVSGVPLFSSAAKFNSGTGWPSFVKPIDPRFLNKVPDKTHGMLRVEVESMVGAHIGHVFYDGPEPTHLRYCMNSAAMKFIPKDEMKEKGYGEYLWIVN